MKILVAIDGMNFDINDGNASIESKDNTMCVNINSIEKNGYGECTTDTTYPGHTTWSSRD